MCLLGHVASSRTDPERALVKCIIFNLFFCHTNAVFSLLFFKGMWFSFAFKAKRDRQNKGVQEDMQINKAEFVEKSFQLDSCHRRLVYS